MIRQTEALQAVGCEVEADEAAQLARVRGGDAAACEEFVRAHGGRILAVARRFLRCPEDAADAVQDAFLSAFRSLHEFTGAARISTWLHRITVNVCLMKLRSTKSKPTTSIENLLPAFDHAGRHARQVSTWNDAPPERLHTAEMRMQVRQCIDKLPEPYRVVLLLRDIEELDTLETAQRLNLSTTAVKVRLHRARQALRTLLDPVFRGN